LLDGRLCRKTRHQDRTSISTDAPYSELTDRHQLRGARNGDDSDATLDASGSSGVRCFRNAPGAGHDRIPHQSSPRRLRTIPQSLRKVPHGRPGRSPDPSCFWCRVCWPGNCSVQIGPGDDTACLRSMHHPGASCAWLRLRSWHFPAFCKDRRPRRLRRLLPRSRPCRDRSAPPHWCASRSRATQRFVQPSNAPGRRRCRQTPRDDGGPLKRRYSFSASRCPNPMMCQARR